MDGDRRNGSSSRGLRVNAGGGLAFLFKVKDLAAHSQLGKVLGQIHVKDCCVHEMATGAFRHATIAGIS